MINIDECNSNITTSHNMGIDKTILQVHINNKATFREMSKLLNCSIANIQYWMRQYKLKTIRGKYRGKAIKKKAIPILPIGIKRYASIDITEISTIRSRGKKKRITKNSIFAIEFDNVKLAYVMDRSIIHLKEVITQIMLKISQTYDINVACGDKEFSYLNDVGIYYFKSATWNCSKQINEKHFGNLKNWIYPLIQYDKTQLKLKNEDLLKCDNLVFDNYAIQLKNNGYTIIDKRIEYQNTQQLKQIRNSYGKLINPIVS